MKRNLNAFVILALLLAAPASAFMRGSLTGPLPPSTCPFGTALADGCSGAQANGTIVNANLATPKQVIALNIIGGSGYTNGTYTWTSSGGGCSPNASGTVTVSGGALVFSNASYTIANPGAGCTSRPTIAIPAGAAGGTGGSITPTVYQLTPHNYTTPFNVPGVDYPIGYDTTLTLKDPTAGGLPCGSFAGSTLTVNSGTCTLNGYDFSLHNTHLVISGSPTVTISNSKFACLGSASLAQISVSGTPTAIIEYNTANGGASPGTGCNTSGGQNAGLIDMSITGGSVTIQYNYCFNADSKCVNQGNGGTSGSPAVIVEQYNFWSDFGICGGGCSHGEAEYYFTGASTPSKVTTWTMQFNVMLLDFNVSTSHNTTSAASNEADGGTLNNPMAQYNMMLAQGTQSYTGSSNANGQVASAALFCGAQEGGGYSGTAVTQHNFLDYSGGFFPYNSAATCAAGMTTVNDLNAGSGNSCNTSSCN